MTDPSLESIQESDNAIPAAAIMLNGGDVIFSEITYFSYEEGILVMQNPIKIQYIFTPEGEITTSAPFMPYSDQTIFPIPIEEVLVFSPLDEFFTRFYGSSLMRFAIQREKRNISLKGQGNGMTEALANLHNVKKTLEEKYGFVPAENEIGDESDQIQNLERKKVLH